MKHFPHARRRFAAFLFDMDGTLLNSIASANRTWTRWAESHHLDASYVLKILHGVRTIETVRRLNVPGLDPEQEARAITEAEINDVGDVTEIVGARTFLSTLPPNRWAIVTSASRALASARLTAAGIEPPRVFITAEDVSHGKPAPDCYLLAAEKLGVDTRQCLIWEDTLAGVEAAEACGAAVMVISATHSKPLDTQHPHARDYAQFSATLDPSGMLMLT